MNQRKHRQGKYMGFFHKFFKVYKLYQNGEIDSLIENLQQAKIKKNQIITMLSGLDADVRASKQRLGAVQDAVVRQNLGLNTDVDFSSQHICFETTYRVIASGCSPFLVGPAGSGKSTILAQIADAMDLQFYPMSVNSMTSDYNIIGYNDANGNYIPTVFRQAYEHGGIFSFEEIDAGNPNVLTVINNAMSQDKYSFPDKIVNKHPKFILCASGNTYGTGANIKYIGRNPLDAATLDRFVMVYTDYDTNLESRLCANKDWLSWVWAVRGVVNRLDMNLVVGTRAVLHGEKLLNAGLPRQAVEQMVVFKGMPMADAEKIRGNIR